VLRWSDPTHAASPVVTFLGETTLLQSMWRIAGGKGLRVTVTRLPKIDIASMDRRAAADAAREVIAAVLEPSTTPDA
jgi:1-acyl-sn-glycerol-3-phosphate acyltransferase